MTKHERAGFGSKLGAMLAAAGSAVGLGNIWRFPTQAGENGGAAFILVYVLCVLLMGLPVMIAEFVIGRHARANTASAYEKLAPGSQWKWVGRLGVLAAFLILSYYAVVAGWTLEYTVASLVGRFGQIAHGGGGQEAYSVYFNQFVADPVSSVAYTVVFLLLTHVVIVRGVQGGIERGSKVFMPVLFILLVVLTVCALTMSGAAQGVRFLFAPDFGKITWGVVLSAMGQAFYSLSLGMGCLCTYASYFRADTKLGKTALGVAVMDTSVAVMAGLIIFPAVFSAGAQPDAGPSLIFITLPGVFQSAFGAWPVLAYFFSLLFYVLLVLATLTSTISLHEVVTAYLAETRHMSRQRAAVWVTVGCTLVGAACALSMGVWSGYRLGGMNLFDLFDYVTAKWMLPVAGVLIAVFVGWRLQRQVVEQELTCGGRQPFSGLRLFVWWLRYVVPVLIVLVFLGELGLV